MIANMALVREKYFEKFTIYLKFTIHQSHKTCFPTMFATLYFIIFTQLNNDTDAWDGKDYGGIALAKKKKSQDR